MALNDAIQTYGHLCLSWQLSGKEQKHSLKTSQQSITLSQIFAVTFVAIKHFA